MIFKNYEELKKIKTFKGRYEYLKLNGVVGDLTFGHNRHINQKFYTSSEWRSVRDEIIVRDGGCDLGVPGYEIWGNIYIHHIIPITAEDILKQKPLIYDLNNLISTSFKTHNAIHYSEDYLLPDKYTPREPGDTTPW